MTFFQTYIFMIDATIHPCIKCCRGFRVAANGSCHSSTVLAESHSIAYADAVRDWIYQMNHR